VIGAVEVFVAAGCPLVPLRVVQDTPDAGAQSALTVVPVVAGAVAEVVVHAQVVAELVSHQLKCLKRILCQNDS
jgi:hypothetical protein